MWLPIIQKKFLLSLLKTFKEQGVSYALYGTGKVAREMLFSIYCEGECDLPSFVLDHTDSDLSAFMDVPYYAVSNAPFSEVQAVILGTNIHQFKMREQLKNAGAEEVIIVDPATLPVEPPSPVYTQWRTLEKRRETLLPSDHYDILGKVYMLSRQCREYMVFGCADYVGELIELVRFHELLLPVGVVISCDSETQREGDISGIPVHPFSMLGKEPHRPILVAGKRNIANLVTELNTRSKVTLPILKLFGHDSLTFRYQDHMVLPFSANMTVNFGVTKRCNLKCIYCPEHSDYITSPVRKRRTDDLPLEKALELLPQMKGHVSNMRLDDFGEPLLYRDLETLYAESRKYIPTVDIVTNGVALTEKRSLSLAESGLERLVVSLDSLHDDYHQKVRSCAASKVIENMELFSRATGLPIQINVTLTKANVQEINQWISLKKRVPTLSHICLTPIMNYPHLGALKNPLLNPPSFTDILRIKNLEPSFKQSGIVLDVDDFLTSGSLGTPCCLPWAAKSKYNVWVITSDGVIYPCWAPIPLDNVFDLGFMGAVNGSKIQRFRKDLLRGNYPEVCKICGYDSLL